MTGARWWPAALALVLGVTVLANVALLWTASHDAGYVVEPDYYRKAVEWDSTVARHARSDALGWQADVRLAAPDRDGATLTVRLANRGGAALDSATVRAELSHNAHGADRFAVPLAHAGPGLYTGVVPSQRRGLWRVDLDATSGSDAFVERVTVDNGPGGVP